MEEEEDVYFLRNKKEKKEKENFTLLIELHSRVHRLIDIVSPSSSAIDSRLTVQVGPCIIIASFDIFHPLGPPVGGIDFIGRYI